MEKIEKRTVIKYLFIERMSTKEIYYMFVTLGDDGPSYSAVKNWVAEFKCGRSSVVDEHHSGRPKDATSAEDIQIINDVLNKVRRLTIRHIAETIALTAAPYIAYIRRFRNEEGISTLGTENVNRRVEERSRRCLY